MSTQAAFYEWREAAVTKAWFQSLEQAMKEKAQGTGMGAAIDGENTAVRYAEQAGICKGMEEAINHVPDWAESNEEEQWNDLA